MAEEKSYTIQFDIYQTKDSYGAVVNNLAVPVQPDGGDPVEAFKTTIPSDTVIPHVNIQPGYVGTASVVASGQLESAFYKPNAANGLLTQGAFAIKFEQETYVDSAVVNSIMATYSSGLVGLVEDYITYVTCGRIDANPSNCPPQNISKSIQQHVHG